MLMVFLSYNDSISFNIVMAALVQSETVGLESIQTPFSLINTQHSITKVIFFHKKMKYLIYIHIWTFIQ